MVKKIVLVTDDPLIKESVKNPRKNVSSMDDMPVIITLPHPFYQTNSSFLYSNGNFYEINQVEHADSKSNPHSWFLGNTVVANGTLYISTPVDPIFLAYPFIEEACKYSQSGDGCFVNIEHVLSQNNTNCRWTNDLATTLLSAPAKLERIFDYIYIDVDNQAKYEESKKTIQVRHNEKKFIRWLQGRVACVALAMASIPSIAPGYFFTEHGKQKVKYETFSHKFNRSPNDPTIALISSHCSILIQIALDYISRWISPSILHTLLSTYSFEDSLIPNTYKNLSVKELQNNLKISLGDYQFDGECHYTELSPYDKENIDNTDLIKKDIAHPLKKIAVPVAKSSATTRTSKKALTAPQGNTSILSFLKR